MTANQPPRVEIRRSARRTRTINAHREGDTIVVLAPLRLSAHDEQLIVPDLVEKVLRKEATSRAARSEPALTERARALGSTWLEPVTGTLPLTGVRWVSNQTTRWASCTSVEGRSGCRTG